MALQDLLKKSTVLNQSTGLSGLLSKSSINNSTQKTISAPQLTDQFSPTAQSTPQTTTTNINPIDIVKQTGQGIARTVASVGVTAGNKFLDKSIGVKPFDESIPTAGNKVTSAIFGGQPIQTVGKNISDVQKSIEPYIGKTGSNIAATPLVLAGIAMDLSGFGGESVVKTIGEIPEAFFKNMAKETSSDVIEGTLRKVGIDQVTSKILAPQFASSKTAEEAKTILANFGKAKTESNVAKIALSKNPDEIAGFLGSLGVPESKIPIVAHVLTGLNDPKKIQTVLDGVIQGEKNSALNEQRQAYLEQLKSQVDSNPLNQNTKNDRLLFNPKEGGMIALDDMKSPAQIELMTNRMAEAGYSDPQLFVDDYQKLQEQKAQIKALEGEVKQKPLKYSAEGIPLSTKSIESKMADKNLPELKTAVEQPKFVREPDVPVPDSVTGLLKRNITPLKFVDESAQKVLRDWNYERITGKEMANQTAQTVKIPGDSMDLIHKYQAGENLPQTPQIKKIFDDLRQEAIARGIDVKERQNYIPQVYAGSPSKVQGAILKYLSDHGVNDEMAQDYINGVKPLPEEVALRLKLSPSFEKERVFPTYKVAQEFGLTPKYDKISDLVAYYRNELGKVIANKNLVESLVSQGKIMPTGNAPKEWIPLNNQFSNNIHYSAPANLAKVINDIFANPDLAGLGAKIVGKVATASKFAQEVALSAGIPNTTVNFFAIGQLVKELTAGNIKSISAFIRANSDSATVKFFNEHKQTLLDMAEQNIDMTNRTGSFDQKSLTDLVQSKEFKQAIGHGLDIAFGKKTFESFMPMMQVQLFEDVYKTGIKNGLSEIEAKKLAGDTLRKNFGLNTDAFAQGQITKDTLSAIFFAPKFRESIIRTLFETGKAGSGLIKYLATAGKSKIDPSSYRNLRLIGGMILSFAIYNEINRKLNNGQNMWENPSGKEFALRIPRENGEVVYIEFMPSFLAFARNIGSGLIATGKGDFKSAEQKFGSVFSMPLKITSEVLSNSDYFGNPIYKDSDSTKNKALKIAEYIGLQVNHPYVKEVVSQIENKKPLYQSLVAGLELPLKFSSKEKESTASFYNALDAKAKETAQIKEKFSSTFNEIQNLIRDGKIDEAKSMVKSLTDEQYKLYKTMKSSLKSSSTFSGKAKMYDTYNVVQDLIKNGQSDKAKTIINSLSEDEYKYYKSLKKQFGDKKAVSVGESKNLLAKVIENTIGAKTASAMEVPKSNSELDVDRIKNEIAFRESGTSTTPYTTVGVTKDLGKYQVNPQTLKDYSQKFLGKTVTKEEFLKSPALQEKFMENAIKHLRSLGAKSLDAFLILWHRGWGDISAKRVKDLKQDPEVKKYLNNKRKELSTS